MLGVVNAAGKGAAGLEYQYNTHAGREGRQRDAAGVAGRGRPARDAGDGPAVGGSAGTGLELTLDEPLQYTTEQALAAEIVVVARVERRGDGDGRPDRRDPLHGQPGGQPEGGVDRRRVDDELDGDGRAAVDIGPKGPVTEAPSNLALTQLYEPGSVFKLVTFSAALQDGLINPNTTFTVPDQITLDGSTFHDAETHPTEQLTATQILAQSSNIGTVRDRPGPRREPAAGPGEGARLRRADRA